jgi:Inositol monophosphatase family
MFASAASDHRRNINALFIAIFCLAGIAFRVAFRKPCLRTILPTRLAKSDWQEVTLSYAPEPLRILVPAPHPAVRSGVPVAAHADEAGWETRKTGSAALEWALVAAGLLEVARFSAPNFWDVAAGIALVQAGGGVVREHDGMRWIPMQRFAPASRAGEKPDLRSGDGQSSSEPGRG